MSQKLPFVWNRHGALEGYPFDAQDIEVLTNACPKLFRENNPWSKYALEIIEAGGVDIFNWKWRDNSDEVRGQQFEILRAWLNDTVPHKYKLPVAGWMLSEMITEPA